MRKTKKRFFVYSLLLVFVAVSMLLGCGESKEEKKDRIHKELGLVDEITAEIGTASFNMDLFFGGSAPEVEYDYNFSEEVTAEMLSELGEHELTLTCEGIEFALTLKVVDMVAPVFTSSTDFEITEGDNVLYKSYVTAEDNSGKEPEITVDKSGVEENTPGEYTVTYIATDEAGNTATVSVKMTIKEKSPYTDETVGPLCDEIIDDVCSSSMSDFEKAHELYRWVKHNLTYNNHDDMDTSNIWAGAYKGIKERQGDCVTFYCTYAALLTRCNIENMMVHRINGETNHYWHLVNVGDGWYHVDTCPHNKYYKFDSFMQTDAQMEAYTNWYSEYKRDYYTFDKDAYPERETKIVWGK